MVLLLYYIITLALLTAANIFIGYAVESVWGPIASLMAFLVLFFSTLWLSWVISVWLTKPRGAKRPGTGAIDAKAQV